MNSNITLSQSKPTQITFASKYGKLTSISDVSKGLDCECLCLDCAAPLIAKKGEVNAHHFSHASDQNHSSCSVESTLHKASKKIIQQNMSVLSAPLFYTHSGQDSIGHVHVRTFVMPTELLTFRECLGEEAAINGSFIPDITGYSDQGEQTFYIEIIVTNDVSPEKYAKVCECGIPMLSIDMSGYIGLDSIASLELAVLRDAPRKWVYHPALDKEKEKLAADLDVFLKEENDRIKILMENHNRHNHIQNAVENLLADKRKKLVLGFKSVSGYSKKTSSHFEINKMFVARVINDVSNVNYNINSQAGIDIDEIQFDPSILPIIEKMCMPCYATLHFEFIRQKPVLVDIYPDEL